MTEPRIRPLPTEDQAFGRAAQDALRRIVADRATGDIEARLLQALRNQYPRVHIEPMSPLAALPGEGPTWYAYRDGRARRTSPIPAEIEALQEADARRRSFEPSTDPYHDAAEEVERVSRDIFMDARQEEVEAEADAQQEQETG